MTTACLHPRAAEWPREAGVRPWLWVICACSLVGNWNYFGWGEQSK